ncbi:hypothetical protein LCGC14_2389470 [marine sediment metagenome]|uniref:Uncharacterized protein n=1 Tax=marine sediment metagenome TaxID=412755 RepID=A0A0F9ET41_9ZZZZ
MCLNIVYRGKQKKEALAKLPENGYYWKVVVRLRGKYYSPIHRGDGSYKYGWNSTPKKSNNASYYLAFHIWRTKEAGMYAQNIMSTQNNNRKYLVRCKIDKNDIINIGSQWGRLCIVTTRFWCPKPK